MKPPAIACRESMEAARSFRWQSWILPNGSWYWKMEHRVAIRKERDTTREILRALRAARRSEGALVERWGVK